MGSRKRANRIKYKYVHGIQCPMCEEKLWSKWVHDFHYCECGYCFIDGGKEYGRIGWGGDGYERPWAVPESVKFRVRLSEWLGSDRNPDERERARFPY